MKTHIPATLRKALLAALFATASFASTSYAKDVDYALDVINWSDGYGETTFGHNEHSTGYTDLTFSGTNPSLGTVDHWCHDYNVISIPDHFTDRSGDDTGIWVEPDYRTGKYIVHSVTADQGKAENTDFDLDDWHDHDSHDEYGYSYSWSNGNIWVDGKAVLEVTTTIDAHGTIDIDQASRVTVGGQVSAGEISVTNGASLTAANIDITRNNLWNPGDDDYDSTGSMYIDGYGTNVTVADTLYADGAVQVGNSGTLNASTIIGAVTGEGGYVRALAGENLTVLGVASEGSQYIVDNGCTITIGSIGYYDENTEVMHGNGNYFGYGQDSSSIKAEGIYVAGDIISDDNKLGALGNNEDLNSSAIVVYGSITGNGNELQVRGASPCGVWVGKDVTGDNNTLTCVADGNMYVSGVLGRAKDGDNGAKGNTINSYANINIGQLSDNEDLTIEAYDGEVVVSKASEGTLLNSTINADDDVVFSNDEVSTTKTLQFVGGEVESETGDIISNQTLSANGTILMAEEGDINVYSLIFDPANVTSTGIQVTAQNLISQEDLKLNGKKTDSFNSFVDVTEDMRTTKGSISITNFTDKDKVKVGHDVESADSITIQNVKGMLVGTEDEEEIQYEGSMTAKKDIEIADSIVDILGDQEATDGKISITKNDSETRVTIDGNQTAGDAITAQGATLRVGILVEEDGADGKPVYSVEGGKQVAGKSISIAAASIVEVLDSMEAKDGNIQIQGSQVTVGAVSPEGKVVKAGDMTAANSIIIDNSSVNVRGSQYANGGDISIQTTGTPRTDVVVDKDQIASNNINVTNADVLVGGNQETKTGEIWIKQGAYVGVLGDQVSAREITISDSEVEVLGSQKARATTQVDGASTVTVGSQVEAQTLKVLDTSQMTVNVASDLPEGETSVLNVEILEVGENANLHTGNVELAEAMEDIHGVVEVGTKDSDPTKDITADWKVTGYHDISGEDAHLKVNGDAEIVAAEGDGSVYIGRGATVSATGDVTIQGLAAALAEVEGANVRADGDIILGNAELKHNTVTDITTKGSDIVLKDNVVIRDTILNVLPPEEGDEGVINVTEGADVQIRRIDIITPSMANVDVFNGKLAGTGSVTAYDDNLTLYHDATAFNGTINMVRDDEQAINIACEGVGEDAVINLKEGSSLYTIVGGQGAHLGNVETTDGSHIQLTAVDEGNTASATSLKLTSGTTYDVFATAGAETGALVSDRITVSDGIDANGAKVAVHTTEGMNTVADGTRFTIVAGEVVTEFNEDVLYDRVRGIGGASTLRKLQTRNMHLEHNANGVDLVVSENYKGINSKNANVNAVREIIMPLDAAADHRPGVLAQSSSNLDHILDALDYTRSGADAKAGLLSVSAAANLIVPNMMMDASRHHLSNLRDHMSTPVCTKNYKGKGNVWAAYVGGHDFIGSDDNMGKYSHSYNGAIIGGDYAVNCNWAIGLSAGYQNSIARTDATRADADAISGDLYVVGRTGKFVHRFSMGLTSYNTDVKRGTRIAAKGHTYDELSTGDADGMSWNFGYQISRSYAINQVSALTPYLAVDVALQRVDTLTEKGQGDASVVTDYEDFVQTDAALGVSYSHTFASFNQQAGVFAVDLALHGEFSEHRATAKNHFVDSPADTWKTRSAKRAPLYGELGGHVLVPFTQHFSGTAGLNFEFSDDRTYIGGHAGVNYRF